MAFLTGCHSNGRFDDNKRSVLRVCVRGVFFGAKPLRELFKPNFMR